MVPSLFFICDSARDFVSWLMKKKRKKGFRASSAPEESKQNGNLTSEGGEAGKPWHVLVGSGWSHKNASVNRLLSVMSREIVLFAASRSSGLDEIAKQLDERNSKLKRIDIFLISFRFNGFLFALIAELLYLLYRGQLWAAQPGVITKKCSSTPALLISISISASEKLFRYCITPFLLLIKCSSN